MEFFDPKEKSLEEEFHFTNVNSMKEREQPFHRRLPLFYLISVSASLLLIHWICMRIVLRHTLFILQKRIPLSFFSQFSFFVKRKVISLSLSLSKWKLFSSTRNDCLCITMIRRRCLSSRLEQLLSNFLHHNDYVEPFRSKACNFRRNRSFDF